MGDAYFALVVGLLISLPTIPGFLEWYRRKKRRYFVTDTRETPARDRIPLGEIRLTHSDGKQEILPRAK